LGEPFSLLEKEKNVHEKEKTIYFFVSGKGSELAGDPRSNRGGPTAFSFFAKENPQKTKLSGVPEGKAFCGKRRWKGTGLVSDVRS